MVPQQAVQSTDDEMSEDELTDSDEDLEEAGGPDDGSDPKVLDPQGLAMGTLMLKKKVRGVGWFAASAGSVSGYSSAAFVDAFGDGACCRYV